MTWSVEGHGLVGTHEMVCDGVVITGDDAATFLAGQLSADIAALDVGAHCWSLLLEPDGKLVSLVRVRRSGETAFLLDADEGAGEVIAVRLRRFCIRTAASIDQVALFGLRVFGDIALGGGTEALTLLGRAGKVVDVVQDVRDPSWSTTLGDDEVETWRIWRGVPRFGAEITSGLIAASLGDDVIAETVSFTKGCYTGQELVARLDARGTNVPFHLALLQTKGDAAGFEPGVVLLDPDSGKAIGTVTSVAPGATDAKRPALCYLHRSATALSSVLAPPLTAPVSVLCVASGVSPAA